MNTREAGRPARLVWKERVRAADGQYVMAEHSVEGMLLGIGSEVEEAEGSVASCTVAFLELPDGSVTSGLLCRLQFLDKKVMPNANPA